MKHNIPGLPEYFAVKTPTFHQFHNVVQLLVSMGYPKSDQLRWDNINNYVGIWNYPVEAHVWYRELGSINNFKDPSEDSWPETKAITYEEWQAFVGDAIKNGVADRRKIIGYKLLKDYPCIDDALKTARELVVVNYHNGEPCAVTVKGQEKSGPNGTPLHFGFIHVSEYPEFWEPIYEQAPAPREPEVGDWITYTSRASKEKRTDQIIRIDYNPSLEHAYLRFEGNRDVRKDGTGAPWAFATAEEIEAASYTKMRFGSEKSYWFKVSRGKIEVQDCDGIWNIVNITAVRRIIQGFSISGFHVDISELTMTSGGVTTKFIQQEVQQLWNAYMKHTPDWHQQKTLDKVENEDLPSQ